MNIFAIFILYPVAFFCLAYILFKISGLLSSRIVAIEWLLKTTRKSEFFQASVILTLIIVSFGSACISSINESQKGEIWDNKQAWREEKDNFLAEREEKDKKILSLEREKSFAFQPEQAPVVKTEVQENPQKEDSSQNKVVLAEKQDIEQAPANIGVEENKQEILANIKAQIDLLKLEIEAAKVQAASQAIPVPANTGTAYIGGEIRIIDAVSKIN